MHEYGAVSLILLAGRAGNVPQPGAAFVYVREYELSIYLQTMTTRSLIAIEAHNPSPLLLTVLELAVVRDSHHYRKSVDACMLAPGEVLRSAGAFFLASHITKKTAAPQPFSLLLSSRAMSV